MTQFAAPGEAPVGDGDPFAGQTANTPPTYPIEPGAPDAVPTLAGQTPTYMLDGMRVGEQVDPRQNVERTSRDSRTPNGAELVATQPVPTETLPPTQPERRRGVFRKVALAAGAVALAAAVVIGVGTKVASGDHSPTTSANAVPTATAQAPKAARPSPTQEAGPQSGNIQPEKALTLGPIYTVTEAGKDTTLPKFLLVPGTTAPNGEVITPTDTVDSFLAQYQRMLASNDAGVVEKIIDHMVDDPNGIGSNIANKLRSDWQRMQNYRQDRTSKGYNTPYVLTIFADPRNIPADFGFNNSTNDAYDAFGNRNIDKTNGVIIEYFYAATRPDVPPSGPQITQLGISTFRIAVSPDGHLTNIVIQEVR